MSLIRARSLVGLARWPEALQELQPVLADPPGGPEPWCLLAQIRLGLGEPQRAVEAAERAIAIAPEDEFGHRLRAVGLLRQRRLKDAERAARRAVQSAPGRMLPLYVLVEVLVARRSHKDAAAVAQLNVENHPEESLAWESAATVAVARREWPRAEELARRGLALAPQDGDLMVILSEALARQGKQVESANLAVAAIRAEPRSPRGRRQLERVLVPTASVGATVLGVVLVQVLRHSIPASWTEQSGVRTVVAGLGLVLLVCSLCYLPFLLIRRRRRLAELSPELRRFARRARQEQLRPRLLLMGGTLALPAVLVLPRAPIAALVFGVMAAAAVGVGLRLPKRTSV